MWRKLVIVLGVLNCPLMPAALACGDPYHPPVPTDAKPEANGDYVKKTSFIKIKGKLSVVRCLMFGRTNISVTAAGETFWLDLRGNKHWHWLVQQAGDRPVIVTGELDEAGPANIVNVTDLRIDEAEFVIRSLKVEIQIEQFAASLVGKDAAEARRLTLQAGFRFRIVEEDGVGLPTTDDLRRDRINVAIKKGKITAARVG